MTWYVITFLLCVLGFILNTYFVKDEKIKKYIDIGLIIFLCIITGTRYNIGGYDYGQYRITYDFVPKLWDFNFFTVGNIYGTWDFEVGFLFLCSFFKTIGFTYYGFTLICSIIFYICLYKGLRKYTKNFTFLIIIFLYKLFIFQTFVLTRQMLCLGGFFILIKYMINKKFWKYLIGCLLLSTIHTTSLIFIPVYFINKINLNKNLLIKLTFIFVPTMLISLLNIPIFDWIASLLNLFGSIGGRMAYYIKYMGNSEPINILNTIEYLLLMGLIIYRYDDLIKQNENNKIWIKVFLVMLPILTLFRGYEVLARIKDYFVIVYAFLIEALLNLKFKKIHIPKYMITFGIIMLCFIGYIRYVNNFGNGALLPYNSYINDNVQIIDFGGK